MASEEAQFVARAERLAGPTGVVGFQRAAAREACLLYTSDAADEL